jgi:hypothetical protein
MRPSHNIAACVKIGHNRVVLPSHVTCKDNSYSVDIYTKSKYFIHMMRINNTEIRVSTSYHIQLNYKFTIVNSSFLRVKWRLDSLQFI